MCFDVCMYVGMSAYRDHACVHVYEWLQRPEEGTKSLGAEVWVLGTELTFSVRAARTQSLGHLTSYNKTSFYILSFNLLTWS